jgi:predicted GNAT family acetyltransferase
LSTDVSLVPPLRVDARRIEMVTDATRAELSALVAENPVVNAVIDARLASYRTVDAAVFGGRLPATRDSRGRMSGAAFDGGNLIPIGGTPPDWSVLAAHAGDAPRRCTSITGRADAVAALWTVLESRWSPARAVRGDQPLLVLHRGDPVPVRPDPRVRVLGREHLASYLPAAAEMFTEELGVSPFDGPLGGSYRHRVEFTLGAGRALGIVDDDGRIAFKADLGVMTAATVQVQGVWTRPDLRGRGLGTAAMAHVIDHALRLAPTVSLYVNDFNAAARRMYQRLGMRQLATLATVLF